MELVAAITDYFSPNTVETLADNFGAGADQVEKGIAALAPAILAATANRLTGDRGSSLFAMLSSSSTAEALAQPAPRIAGDQLDAADDYVRGVLGGEFNRVVEAVSSRSGLDRQTTGELATAVGAVIMGVLGRKVATGTTHNGLVGVLAHSQSAIANSLPSELKNLAGVSQHVVAPSTQPVRWFWPIVVGAGVLFALYTWKRSENQTSQGSISAAKPISSGFITDEPTGTTAESPPALAPAHAPHITAIGFRKAVPSNEGELEIVGSADGAEAQLLAFIEDPDSVVDPDLWFNLDALTFAEGEAELDTEKSAAQLNNLVALLKAYPNVYIKIAGQYTQRWYRQR